MADLISMLAAAAGAGGGETDPFFQDTVLLLHGDGTNGAQNNTFLDSSTNNFTITRNGNTTQGSFSPFSKPDGAWGNYFTDAGGDYFSLAADAALVPPTSSAFTVECWIYPTGSTANPIFNEVYSGGSNKVALAFNLGSAVANTSGLYPWIGFYNGSAWSGVISDVAVNANEWSHIACVFTGSAVEIYINGSAVATTGSISTWVSVVLGDGWRIGKSWTTGGELTGYLSNLRYVNGSAVYSSGFTPSGPLTAITNTVLLTCQSNRFVDNSSNSFALTVVGTPKVTPFSPFPITTEYSPSVNGGSGYFDGSGDYLTVPDDAALEVPTQDFTIEAWVYLSSLPASGSQYTIVQKGRTGTSNFEYSFEIDNNSGSMRLVCRTSPNGSSLTTANGSTISLVAGSWNHVAVTRTSTTASFWFNGVAAGTGTVDGTTYTGSAVVAIGANDAGSSLLVGYMASFRFVKGSQVYSSAFTPPTAPLTAIANTSLLCNFTNAGIFDNTGFNNLETVADAQIDTTTKKYGTGSMEFDGTGDWLLMPNNENQQLGTGDFTIEFWVYLATGDAGSNRGLVAKGTSTTGFLVSLNTTEKVVFTYTTSTITSTGAITLDAWNHIAVVREGTGSNETKIYIGGTNDGTGTVSTDFNQTSVMYVGANRTGGDPMKGFIDDLRITKGVARYTTTFTPPTKAFPNIGA